MGICASKPKTKEIDLSHAPETPRAKGHTRDRSIDTNITIGKDELSQKLAIFVLLYPKIVIFLVKNGYFPVKNHPEKAPIDHKIFVQMKKKLKNKLF